MNRTNVYRLGFCLFATLSLSLWAGGKKSVRQFEVHGAPDLELINVSGDIEVVAGHADLIQVTWTLYDDQIKVYLTQSDRGKVRVKVDYPTRTSTRSGVDFRIEFPADNGRLSIQSVSGDISLSDVGGDLRLHTVSGRVTAENSSGSLDLNSVSGNVNMSNLGVSEIDARSISGNVSYSGGSLAGGLYDLSSTSGNIRIQHDRSASYEISGRTISGSIRNNVGGDIVVEKSKYTSTQTVSGKYGDGQVRVRANTVSGNISLDFD